MFALMDYHLTWYKCCPHLDNVRWPWTLFKDGDPVSLQLIFPGAIQTCEQYNNCSYTRRYSNAVDEIFASAPADPTSDFNVQM